jgi:integrase
MLTPGALLPSVPGLSTAQGVRPSTLQHALKLLAADGLIIVRQGRPAVVAGTSADPAGPRSRRPGPGHDCALSGCRPHACKPMSPRTIRIIHSIVSGAFAAAERWEWIDGKNPADAAELPAASGKSQPATPPEDVAKVIAACRASRLDLALFAWLAAVTGVRRGELCDLQIRDIDLDGGVLHVARNYVVRAGRRIHKDTKTHQDRWLAIDPDTCALIRNYLDETGAALAAVGLKLPGDAYLFSNDPVHTRPWNPDWATHKVADAATAARVELDIKGLRHYTASQLLAASFDLRNTAARLGHSGGGATTLKHYADPVSEVDRRAAAYLSQLTAAALPVPAPGP